MRIPRFPYLAHELVGSGYKYSQKSASIECGYRRFKTSIDFVLAVILLLITAPIIAFSMILVRLTSEGPSIYSQRRIGQRGRIFTLYKIRTMYQNSERDGARWCVPGDARITPVGRVLRWSHLDELPQLINVLKGEMSLVGPRPERPEFVDRLELELPDYRRRLSVRAGLTGLAQIQQPPDTDLSSVRTKLEYDLYYVEGLSFWLDARLLIGTVLKCLGVPFGWIGRILQLPGPNDRGPRNTLVFHDIEITAKSVVSDSFAR